MFGELLEIRDTLRDLLAAFEPGCYSGADAARLVEDLAEVEKLATAGKVLAARRVEESNLWRAQGFRSAAHWTATKTGTSVGEAVGALQTARSLEDLPETAEAFRAGRLSEAQAREVTAAAVAHPAAEGALRFDARLTADDGARVLAAITPRQARLAAEGRA